MANISVCRSRFYKKVKWIVFQYGTLSGLPKPCAMCSKPQRPNPVRTPAGWGWCFRSGYRIRKKRAFVLVGLSKLNQANMVPANTASADLGDVFRTVRASDSLPFGTAKGSEMEPFFPRPPFSGSGSILATAIARWPLVIWRRWMMICWSWPAVSRRCRSAGRSQRLAK